MAKMVAVFRDEISKLAKKEMLKSQKVFKKLVLALKRENTAIRKRLKALEAGKLQGGTAVAAITKNVTSTTNDEVEKSRITPKLVLKLRKKHGLSRHNMAMLMDVNHKSVERWEKGIGMPQREQKKKIIAFRKLSAHEIKKMIADLKKKKIEAAIAAGNPPKKRGRPSKKA